MLTGRKSPRRIVAGKRERKFGGTIEAHRDFLGGAGALSQGWNWQLSRHVICRDILFRKVGLEGCGLSQSLEGRKLDKRCMKGVYCFIFESDETWIGPKC